MSDAAAEHALWMRNVRCYVPSQHAHLKWHVLRADMPPGSVYERAEWVPDNGSGNAIWIRWGYCGCFAELTHAVYIGPAIDQDSPYVHPASWEATFEPRDNLAEVR